MNIIDIIILILVAFAAINGFRLGAATLICSYGGFFIGLVIGFIIGSLFSKSISHSVSSAPIKLLIGVAILFFPAIVLGSFGHVLGTKVRSVVNRHNWTSIDTFFGIVVSAVATLLIIWILGNAIANSPNQRLNALVQRSTVMRAFNQILPPIPIQSLRSLLISSGFPVVFSGFAPIPPGTVATATSVEVSQVQNKDYASVLKIQGFGCGEVLEGTAFVVAPHIVVTNAHVVAGVYHPQIIDGNFSLPAYLMYFDPNFDLAVLRVPQLNAPALTFSNTLEPNGSKTVFLGYPEGGGFNAQPSAILQEFAATGPNIYGNGNYTRNVYQIEGYVRPGNSGSPLLNLQGQVIGLVFSRSTTDSNVGYALTSAGVSQKISTALSESTTAVNEGCTNG
jgi:S1-C subfamily serine protease